MRIMSEVVCVTGGSGFIGSWLVQLLLHRGYTVHATVKDLKDERETNNLFSLDGAKSRLKLFQIDLLDYASIANAVTGTMGVFHLASPNIIDQVQDPEENGVARVVVTSSISSITPSLSWPADLVKGEDCCTDVEHCKQKKLWYPLSKTFAEKEAWNFVKGTDNMDVVVVNPGTTLGPILPPILNSSMTMLLHLLQLTFWSTKTSLPLEGICVSKLYGTSELYPEYNVPRFPRDTQPELLRAENAAKKLMDLGLKFIPMEQIIQDAVESLKAKGFIS
ncbi:hypothetical protein Droror1_Dr00004371 [Drosera rotundifolia]